MTTLQEAEAKLKAARAALPQWDDLPTAPAVMERLIDAKIDVALAPIIKRLEELSGDVWKRGT